MSYFSNSEDLVYISLSQHYHSQQKEKKNNNAIMTLIEAGKYKSN